MKKNILLLAAAFSFAVFSISCGETSKKDAEAGAAASQTATATYSCPMHPDITSNQPGSCSQCGMDLEATATQTEAGNDHGHDHDHGADGHSH